MGEAITIDSKVKSGATPRRRQTQGNAHQESQKSKVESQLLLSDEAIEVMTLMDSLL
ncbi:MAG: hypothetical protein F6K24_10110 [Okeania sp. SIO2D1]|nr:hypothetical protein [Okeania sp. SIO2D1]